MTTKTNITQMRYSPPDGIQPAIGFKIRCFDGLRSVVEVVTQNIDGSYLVRLQRVHEDEERDSRSRDR